MSLMEITAAIGMTLIMTLVVTGGLMLLGMSIVDRDEHY